MSFSARVHPPARPRPCSSLEHLQSLEELNLADNRIASFAEIPHFARLAVRLRALYLSDPHFGDNPVCALCNYRTYAVHQVRARVWVCSVYCGRML